MSSIADIALAAAQRLEKSVSAKVALPSYKALFEGNDKRVVLAAAQGALRCALVLGDRDALAEVLRFWETLRELDGFATIASHCKTLHDKPEALILAAAEVKRRPSARAHYLQARLLQGARKDERALACFRLAIRCARPEDARIACWSQCVLLRAQPTLDLAKTIDLDHATEAQQLLVAEVLLSSPSKFVRARALSLLERLADSHPRAVVIAARHADSCGAELSWVESQRLAATIDRWPDATERKRARLRLDALSHVAASDTPDRALAAASHDDRYMELAQAIIDGIEVDVAAARADREHLPASSLAAYLGLEAIAAIKAGRPDAAREALVSLPDNVGRPAPPSLWTAVLLGLKGDDEKLRIRARAVAKRLAPLGPPPRGYMPYHLFELAAARAEPGAAEALADRLIAKAWQAGSDDRLEALKHLKRARTLTHSS